MAYPSVTNSVAGNSGADITSGASWTFNFGFTATSGRLLILMAAADANTTLTASGFTQVVAGNNFSAVKFQVFKKLSDGTETSVNISPNATESIAAILYEISGHNGTTDVTGAAAATGTSASPDPPSVSNFNSGEETAFIACYGFDSNVSRANTGYPSGYANSQLTNTWNNNAGVGVASAIKNSTAASEDPGTFTLNSSDEWVATTVAVRSNQSITGTAAITLSSFTASGLGSIGAGGLSGGFRLSQALAFPLSDSLSIG